MTADRTTGQTGGRCPVVTEPGPRGCFSGRPPEGTEHGGARTLRFVSEEKKRLALRGVTIVCFFLITKAISRSGHTGQIKCALLILLLSESSRLTGELLFSFSFAFASLSSPARCGGRGPATLSSSCRRLVTPRRPSHARPRSCPCTRTCAALRSHPTESSGRLGIAPRASGPVRSPSRFLGAPD